MFNLVVLVVASIAPAPTPFYLGQYPTSQLCDRAGQQVMEQTRAAKAFLCLDARKPEEARQ